MSVSNVETTSQTVRNGKCARTVLPIGHCPPYLGIDYNSHRIRLETDVGMDFWVYGSDRKFNGLNNIFNKKY